MAESTTGRLRRREPRTLEDPEFEAIVARSKYRHATIVPSPPIPTIPPGPHGDLSRASVDQLVALTREVWPASSGAWPRCQAVRGFLSHLENLPGDSWQERWDASDFAAATKRDKRGTNRISAYRSSVGMKLMFCLRVIRPTLPALRARPIHHYADFFRIAEGDAQLDRFHERVSAVETSHRVRLGGAFDVACALTVYGTRFNELTPEAMLHYAWECRRHGVTFTSHAGKDTFGGLLAWQVLYAMGQFPPATPQSIRAATSRGRLTVEEMVDRYGIDNRSMRSSSSTISSVARVNSTTPAWKD